MIVLDTNVVSELVKPAPAPAVIAWVDAQLVAELAITSVTAAEMFYGVAWLPSGWRQRRLAEQVRFMVESRFARRVLGFDVVAAGHYGDMVAQREAAGRPISTADAQIAAVCRSHGAVLATRDISDFFALDVETVNPWTASVDET